MNPKEFIIQLNKRYPQIIDWGYTEDLEAKSFSHFINWIKDEKHGILTYLSDERADKRKNLQSFYPEASSAIVFLFDYRSIKKEMLDNYPDAKIASYTMISNGEDYHFSLSDILNEIGQSIKQELNITDYKIALDVHPVLDRDLAYRAGLGWFGKNSMLINREYGSYFLIGSIILDQKINIFPKELSVDHCGTCRACIDACPTQAIDESHRTLVANKCISTFTIEQFKNVPAPQYYENSNGEVFGCDICQDVCPWNKKTLLTILAQPLSNKLIHFFNRKLELIYSDLKKMSLSEFKNFFARSSFVRSGKKGLLKNFLMKD